MADNIDYMTYSHSWANCGQNKNQVGDEWHETRLDKIVVWI